MTASDPIVPSLRVLKILVPSTFTKQQSSLRNLVYASSNLFIYNDFFLTNILSCRPLNATLKKLPCRLDSVENLIPYLTKTSRGVISDDSSGFMHVHLHRDSRKLCGFHLGDEKYYFNSLPFGIPSGRVNKIFKKFLL